MYHGDVHNRGKNGGIIEEAEDETAYYNIKTDSFLGGLIWVFALPTLKMFRNYIQATSCCYLSYNPFQSTKNLSVENAKQTRSA